MTAILTRTCGALLILMTACQFDTGPLNDGVALDPGVSQRSDTDVSSAPVGSGAVQPKGEAAKPAGAAPPAGDRSMAAAATPGTVNGAVPPNAAGAAAGASAGDPAADPVSACDAVDDPQQVVLLGDGYWEANGQGIQDELERFARAAGVLPQGESFRDYYENGASMEAIVAQYDMARRERAGVRTVVMNGGGHDILFEEQICMLAPPPDGDRCVRAVERLVRLQREMLDRLARDGVEDVVIYFYPHMRSDTLAGPLLNRTVDYAAPLVRQGCERASGLRCRFVDTRPAFDKDARDLLGLDGILPTEEGSRVLGELLWDAIQGC